MSRQDIYFLSHVLSEKTPLYGGQTNITFKKTKSLFLGDSCNMMYFSFSNHAGTHVDAPFHFVKRGRSISDFKPSEWFFSKIAVVKITKIQSGYIITPDDIGNVKDCDLLLLKTGFERHRGKKVYWENSPGLSVQLGSFLKVRCPSLRAVGVDFISISCLQKREIGRAAHKNFLKNNIMLIEDMRLSRLSKAPTTVFVAPLLVNGADGAPCTVFGIDKK